MDSAYRKIVLEKVVPYYKKLNTTLSLEMVDYFANVKDRTEIMKNFLRFTLYIKDLTVQMSQQVQAYSVLDLLSDIGRLCVVSLKDLGHCS